MQVRIFKPVKSAMQSGDGSDKWILEFVRIQKNRLKENLMGRTSSKYMMSEVRLEFPTLEEAVAYAEAKHYVTEIIKPKWLHISPNNRLTWCKVTVTICLCQVCQHKIYLYYQLKYLYKAQVSSLVSNSKHKQPFLL